MNAAILLCAAMLAADNSAQVQAKVLYGTDANDEQRADIESWITLMMLAFLVDQTLQLCCPLFQAVYNKLGSKRSLWDHVRSHFRHFTFDSMEHLYGVVLYDLAKELPAPKLTPTAAVFSGRSPPHRCSG